MSVLGWLYVCMYMPTYRCSGSWARTPGCWSTHHRIIPASLPLILAFYYLGLLAHSLPGIAGPHPEEYVPLALGSLTLLLLLLPALPMLQCRIYRTRREIVPWLNLFSVRTTKHDNKTRQVTQKAKNSKRFPF